MGVYDIHRRKIFYARFRAGLSFKIKKDGTMEYWDYGY